MTFLLHEFLHIEVFGVFGCYAECLPAPRDSLSVTLQG